MALFSDISTIPQRSFLSRPDSRVSRARIGDKPLALQLRHGRKVTLYGNVRAAINDIVLHRVYDVPGVAFRQCRRVFDLGARAGVFAAYVASQAPLAAIACFEPVAEEFRLLQRNLAANAGEASAHRVKVCARRGPFAANIVDECVLDRADERSAPPARATLSDIFALTGATTCDFLKMDLDGEEEAILLETPYEILRRVRVIAARWSLSEQALPRAQLRLAGAGFTTMVDYTGYTRSQIVVKAWRG